MNLKKQLNKPKHLLIAMFLMLTIAIPLIAIPTVNAHDPPWTIPTYSYVIAVPSTIQLGEYTTIVMWVDQNPPSASGTSGPRWEGYTLNITKPDGSTETIGPMRCDSSVGSHPYNYVPTEVGEYTIVFSWPGQVLANITGEGIRTSGLPFVGDYFEGSVSKPFTFVVQEDPIDQWAYSPLPTEYWQRPIHGANREWSVLGSNWLKGSWLTSNFQRWGTAPNSPHVMWTEPITPGFTGGINDAAWEGIPSNKRDYESPWSAPIIMNGKIYYNAPPVSDHATYGYYCRDLDTGELIWFKNGTDNGVGNLYTVGSQYNLGRTYIGLTQGWLYHYGSVNGEGIVAYLIMSQGSTWYFLDAATGDLRLTMTNVPSGTSVTDQDGSLLRYSYNANTGNLLCWNVSQSIPPLGPTGTNQQQWKMRFGATINAVNDTTWTQVGTSLGIDEGDIRPRSGYTMNVTIPTGLKGDIAVVQDENRVPKMIWGADISSPETSGLGAEYAGGRKKTGNTDQFYVWAARIDEHAEPYSPFPGKTGTQNTNLGFRVTMLYDKVLTVPLPGMNYTWSIDDGSYEDDVFVLMCKHTMQKWGYKLSTGTLLWGPTQAEGIMNYYGQNTAYAYGKILSTGYAGTLYAYDSQNGKLLWTYNATSIGYESPYGENYPISIAAIADEKVYLYSTEHSPTKPYWRGSYLRCVNVTDGTELWKLLDFNTGLGIADGYIITSSEYNNDIICIGKGPSAITVDAPMTGATLDSPLLIRGSVTDISPGTQKYVQTARFPHGVPVVSDDDMQAWMEYVYMQQAKPLDVKGVTVELFVIDANNNYRNIGTTTTDATGFYSYQWTPDIEGKYTVYAKFAGSESYWPSQATTAFVIEDVEATPAPTEPPPSVADQYFIPAIVGLFILGIITLVLIVLVMLKKKE